MKELPDREAFDAALARAGGKLVAIDCTAKWCGPCQMIGPRFEAMEAEFPFADFYKLDVDENQECAMQLGVRAMPTFLFFKHGAKAAEFTGADEGRLRAILLEHAGPPTDIPAGSAVVLRALNSRPELNGRVGRIASFDASKARYAVALDESASGASETLALKRDNLLQSGAAAAVRLHAVAPDGSGARLPEGCEAYAETQTRWFELEGYDADAHAYRLRVGAGFGAGAGEGGGKEAAAEEGAGDGKESVLITAPVACCEPAEGITGIVVGLTGAAEHNGKPARLVAFDGESGRYVVALSASKQLKLKRGCLRL